MQITAIVRGERPALEDYPGAANNIQLDAENWTGLRNGRQVVGETIDIYRHMLNDAYSGSSRTYILSLMLYTSMALYNPNRDAHEIDAMLLDSFTRMFHNVPSFAVADYLLLPCNFQFNHWRLIYIDLSDLFVSLIDSVTYED